MSDLYEVIYVSRRSPTVTDAEVTDGIVLRAGRRNRQLDVTGCLWFDEFRFLQILEGPRDEVERLFDSIRRDSRHHDVQIISASPVASRSFARWAMRSVTGEQTETIESLAEHYGGRAPPGLPHSPAQTVRRQGLVGRIRDRLVRLTNADVCEPVPSHPS